MTYITEDQALAVHKTLSESENRTAYIEARRWAANSYCTRMHNWGITDFDCGSSDTSIELTERIRFFEIPFTPELLSAYAANGVTIPDGAPYEYAD